MTKEQKQQLELEKLQEETKKAIISEIERRARKKFNDSQKDDLINKLYFLDFFVNPENKSRIIFIVGVLFGGYVLFKKNNRQKDDIDKELDYYNKRALFCKDIEQYFTEFVKHDIVEFKELELHAKVLKEYFENRHDNLKLCRTEAHKDTENSLFINLMKLEQVEGRKISSTDLMASIKNCRIAIKKYSK